MPKLGMEIIRRRQVIDAVIRILSEQGWRDLTIREVSEVAGVSSGILAHYFGKKRAMIIDSITEAYFRYRRIVTEVTENNPHPVGQLVALVDIMANPEPKEVPGWSFWLAIDGRMPFDKVIRAEAESHQRFLQDKLSQTFDHGAKLGVFSCTRSLPELSRMFLALIQGLGYQSTLNSHGLSPSLMKETALKWLEPELGIKFQPTALEADVVNKECRNLG